MPDIVIIPIGESTPVLPTSSFFAHGFGLFETMSYADGQLDFWSDHWQRLAKSAKHFALDLPQQDAVLAALRQLVASSELEQATLKLSLVKESGGSRLYVYARPPLPAPEGRSMLLDTTCPIFPRSLLAGHKTHNYMESMHLLNLARAQGYYDTLRVDSQGNLAETTTANVFFIKAGRIFTPALKTGILPGVTRAALVSSPELAVEEGAYLPKSLLEADAVFITNATSGVQPIPRIDGFAGQKSVAYPLDSEPLARIQAVLVRAREQRALQLI
jgi:4-amino-4-deoxychorismate lyase